MYLYDNRLLVYLYIISMSIAYTTRYADITLGFHLQVIIGLLWIAYAICKYIKNGCCFSGKHNKISLFIKIYFIPKLLIHLYTIVLMLLGKVEWKYFSSNLTVYVPTLLAVLSVYLFETKALKYNIYALIISWLTSIGTSLLIKGPGIFVYAIKQAYFDTATNQSINYLELHDMMLALGFIAVFYYVAQLKMTKSSFFMLFSVILMMILGMKRIAVLGVILVIVMHAIIKRSSKKWQYKMCLIAGVIAIVVCYLFIYILASGDLFFDILSRFGIHPMGRNYYYKAIMNYAEFDVSFLGIGRNAITYILNNELSYLRVGGVHSDIIKMYVENGFVMFGIWLWYYLIKVTQIYKNHFGVKSAVMYFMLTAYNFILYFTDNVEIYFTCQILSVILPIIYAIKQDILEINKNVVNECRK